MTPSPSGTITDGPGGASVDTTLDVIVADEGIPICVSRNINSVDADVGIILGETNNGDPVGVALGTTIGTNDK